MKALPTLAVAALAAGVLFAGGPRKVDGSGDPILWNTSTPVTYFVDQGELGTLSNTAANDLVAGAFDTWGRVADAVIEFAIAGQLLEDITGDNYTTDAYPPIGSGISPVIYDDDGSILLDEFGQGAEDDILGITAYGLVTGELLEVSIILNGRCFDGDSGPGSPCEVSFEELRGVVVHEVGHFAGLDHTDLNRHLARDGVVSNNAALPTMYPVTSEDDSTLPTLHLDDKLALARLYPAASFPGDGGTVQGRVFMSDGSTPFNGANVILRNLAPTDLLVIDDLEIVPVR